MYNNQSRRAVTSRSSPKKDSPSFALQWPCSYSHACCNPAPHLQCFIQAIFHKLSNVSLKRFWLSSMMPIFPAAKVYGFSLDGHSLPGYNSFCRYLYPAVNCRIPGDLQKLGRITGLTLCTYPLCNLYINAHIKYQVLHLRSYSTKVHFGKFGPSSEKQSRISFAVIGIYLIFSSSMLCITFSNIRYLLSISF